MNHLRFFIILLSISTLALFSCEKDDNNSSSQPEDKQPVADFVFSGDGGFAPCTVSFTNNSTDATSYSWDFGDNNTSTSTNPTHTYQVGGEYTVTLTAKNNAGNSTVTKTISILYPPTSVKIKAVIVEDMPFTDGGAGWDPDSGPDLYFEITDENWNVLSSSEGSIIDDVTQADLPVSWIYQTDGFTVPNMNKEYDIDLYDNDTGIYAPDDFIDYVGFTMSDYISGNNAYPDEITLTEGETTIRLELQWE